MTTHAKATYVADSDFVLHVGDVRDVLREMPDESVHCVVTSPPYWGLRDYGTGAWDGGDAECDHIERVDLRPDSSNSRISETRGTQSASRRDWPFKDVCGKCGARRVDQQLGLEPTPDEYVANMVAVFREVRRVLRRDGTCWLNIGDSYANSPKGNPGGQSDAIGRSRPGVQASRDSAFNKLEASGLKPKDLVGIPWRLAFALQADGWYLRADIIWAKPNPMPESVTDRPTKAHEYVFLLTRSPRYFFDQEAVREEAEYGRREWTNVDGNMAGVGINGERGHATVRDFRKPPQDTTLDGSEGEASRGPDGRRKTTVQGAGGSIQHRDGERWPNGGRNARSVWEIATQPYAQAHFATFPEALVERCVKAGTSERGCCPECGAPWERQINVEQVPDKGGGSVANRQFAADPRDSGNVRGWGEKRTRREVETTGWNDTCECGRGDRIVRPVPCTVLDPFMGSGTTALVARRLGRKSIGIELNEEYARLAATRLQQLSLLA